jgi:alcohol dehydrogenase
MQRTAAVLRTQGLRREIPRFISLYKRGKLPVRKLCSGFMGFEQVNEGFDKLADGVVPRRVLKPHA